MNVAVTNDMFEYTRIIITEVKITCGHRSNSVRFITVTEHNCKWSIGMTDRL